MTQISSIIKIREIRNIFIEYCKNENRKFDKEEFYRFSNFLEIDIYDWIKENLNQFYKQ
jgi:succinate dehydrogenase flavin-adding protein (antitoxin of CptAB toxin-antitoxin module)